MKYVFGKKYYFFFFFIVGDAIIRKKWVRFMTRMCAVYGKSWNTGEEEIFFLEKLFFR